jgi:hypothetical protein
MAGTSSVRGAGGELLRPGHGATVLGKVALDDGGIGVGLAGIILCIFLMCHERREAECDNKEEGEGGSDCGAWGFRFALLLGVHFVSLRSNCV